MTSFKMLFGTIVKVLSVGIREMGYLRMLCVHVRVWERARQRERLLVILYRDKASIITLLEKLSEGEHWNSVSYKTWSIWRNRSAWFQINNTAISDLDREMHSHLTQLPQMCLQLKILKCFQYSFSIVTQSAIQWKNASLQRGSHSTCTASISDSLL